MKEKIAVIGGGPSGILAAGTAGARKKDVTLFEKNEKLGKKLFITGGGRCNITNKCDIQDFIDQIVVNKEFLYSAFYTFTNEDIISLLGRHGLSIKIERGNRVFPESNKSSDVIKAFENYLYKSNVNIRLNSEVTNIETNQFGKFILTINNSERVIYDKIILATGGKSYPRTGSTGDGYNFARKLGHSIIRLKPSLVPIEIEEEWVKELIGLSLKNVSLKSYVNNRKVHEEFGEMVFTHYGISGPIVLSTSNYLNKYSNEKIILNLDLKPALSKEKLEGRLLRDFEKHSKKHFKNSLDKLLPQKLIPIIIKLSGIEEEKQTHQITKNERKHLLKVLKEMKMTFGRFRPIDEAIVTSGGISTLEINPSTMESKIINNLYFTGEVIDIDALTGGYNLQIAYSTGYLAGMSC